MMLNKEAYKLILESKKIAIFTHSNPDCDGVACSVALKLHCETLNKKVQLFCENKIPDYLNFLPYTKEYKQVVNPNDFDLAIVLDCVNTGRMGKMGNNISRFKKNLVIDHHENFVNFCTVNITNPEASSTGEMLFDFFKANDIEITQEIADCMYCAIASDTGCFMHSNSKEKTFSTVVELLKIGVDNNKYNSLLFKSKTLSQVRLFKRALNVLKFYKNDEIAVCAITRKDFEDTKSGIPQTLGIVNYIYAIEKVKVCFLISEYAPGYYMVSIRSRDGVSSANIAGAFGGGGHFYASGCRAKGLLSDVIDRFIFEARKEL